MNTPQYTLSIIIPVYNEQKTIEEIIHRVHQVSLPNITKEIIVVDDHSTDASVSILRNKLKPYISKLILHSQNGGKGCALRSGFAKATGNFVLIQDADLEYNPSDYAQLLAPLLDQKADIVYGSRFKGSQAHRVLYFWHSVANGFLTLLSNMFTDLNLTDMECGYKVFRREILDQISLKEKSFGFEVEITAKISKLKCRIYEVGISYAGRTYEEGKKINWKDGVRAIWCIIKYNLL
jgi:glycosyltransferase involved in cell wall biosynthesis